MLGLLLNQKVVLGNQAEGTLLDNVQNSINAFSVVASSSYSTDTVSVKVAAGTFKCQVGIYADSAGAPGALLAMGTEIVNPTTAGWKACPFVGSAINIVSGTTYWLGVWTSASGSFVYYSDLLGTSKWHDLTYATNGMSNPFGTVNGSSTARYSIYVPASGYGGTVLIPGVSGWSAVGDVTATGDANSSPAGVSATGSIGTPTVTADANVSVTGVSATGSVGSVTVSASSNSAPSGVSATGSVGSVTVTGDANVSPAGVSATGSVGAVNVSGDANTTATGVQGVGQIGDVTVTTSGDATVTVTGVSATGQVGDVTVTTDSTDTNQGFGWGGGKYHWDKSPFQSGIKPASETVKVSGVSGIGEIGSVSVSASSNSTAIGVLSESRIGDVQITAHRNAEPMILSLLLMD